MHNGEYKMGIQRKLIKRLTSVLVSTCCIASLVACGSTDTSVDTAATTSAQQKTTTETAGVTAVNKPDKIKIYDKMRFITTVPATSTSTAYKYYEEMDSVNKTYCYWMEREYYSIMEYFGTEGAFLHLKIGNNECSFMTPMPNTSELNRIVANMSDYMTVVYNANFINSNSESWVYFYNGDETSALAYEMLIKKGESTPYMLMKMNSKDSSTATSMNSISMTGISELSCKTTSFGNCLKVTSEQWEQIYKAFQSDVETLTSTTALQTFATNLKDSKLTLQQKYMQIFATNTEF